jgi:regulatory helix-turn-helix LysR family protein
MTAFDDLSLLRTFVCIVQCGSISAGARRLKTPQPTLSRHLGLWRNTVARRSCDAIPHRMSLTQTGQRLLADALLSTGRTCRAGSDQPGGCGMSCRQVKAHLRGSLYAPAKGSFTDFAGSYLRPKERIVLVVDSGDQVEEQVRRPIRIGFDKVEGWLCVAALASTNGALASIRSVKFRELPALIAEDPDILVLDVRRRLGLQCSLW